jgi:hypothetical protein
MDQQKLMTFGIAAGILFAAYKFGNTEVRTGAVAVAAVLVARQIPYLNQIV